MASNWELEAGGIMFWKEVTKTVTFEGTTYKTVFAELEPESYENNLVKRINDHTAEITVKDPNGLV